VAIDARGEHHVEFMRFALPWFFVAIVGCGGSSETPAAPVDSGKPAVDAGTDPGSTGLSCTSDGECDPRDAGEAAPYCSTSLAGGSLYPTPVCLGMPCDPGDGTTIRTCDRGSGVCLLAEDGGLCLPNCSFKDDGVGPVGCVEGNACNIFGWGALTDGTVIGVGYCFGGCRSDAECKRTGERCQVEDSLCRKTVVTYPKLIGDACTQPTSGSAGCNCLASRSGSGYCTTACRFGEAGACPAGFSCDSGLPKDKLLSDDIVFTKVPAGIMANCLKNCASDADCAGLGSYCDETVGMMGQRTCQVGKRRCATDAHCTDGAKCVGATADTLGTCG
jgi:hypothetical protein